MNAIGAAVVFAGMDIAAQPLKKMACGIGGAMIPQDFGTQSRTNTREPHSRHSNIQRITPDTIIPLSLELECTRLWKLQRGFPVRIRQRARNDRTLDRDLLQQVRDGHDVTATGLGVDDHIRRDLEEVVECKIIKRPQHILPWRDFLPAARRDVFVVQEQEPEPGVGIRVGGDLGDDEVVEGGVVAGVVGDVQEFGPGVESGGAGGARDEVVAVVRPVADVGAAGLGGDVARGGVDWAFVEGLDGTFDSQVDDASVKRVVSGWTMTCLS